VRWYRAGVIPCDILVPHIDSRVKIIDNERLGASPCDDTVNCWPGCVQ